MKTDLFSEIQSRIKRFGYRRFYIGNQLVEDLSEDGDAKNTYESMMRGEKQECSLPQPHVKTIYHTAAPRFTQKIQDDVLISN